jgi:putative hydrolase of the HAD superfamily
MYRTVVFDLDGVIRHFDPDHPRQIEARFEITPGTLAATAFAPEHLQPAITGEITRADWINRVGDSVGSRQAAREWLSHPGTIDSKMVELIDHLRSEGRRVALLTNGTSTIAQELDEHDLAGHFDVVFNSAEIGYAKPDHRVYAEVCRRLGVTPDQVFFTDDSQRNVDAAIEFGIDAHLFRSVSQLRELLLP